jgi:hypothetical protein
MKTLDKDITRILGPSAQANKTLVDKMAAVEYEEGFYRFAWAIDQESGVALRWGLLNPDTVRAAVANPLREIAITRLRANGRARIRTAITQGLIRGASYPDMMRGIRTAINGNAKDAMRIVRTEGQRAQVLGQQESYNKARDLGVEVQDIWDATLDSRTRTDHGALDNVPAQVDSAGNRYWDTAVGRVAGPTQSGVASFDINCRCRVTGGIEGYEPKLRRIRGEGVVPYQTYDQWKPPVKKTGRNTVKPVKRDPTARGARPPKFNTVREAEEWVRREVPTLQDVDLSAIDSVDSATAVVHAARDEYSRGGVSLKRLLATKDVPDDLFGSAAWAQSADDSITWNARNISNAKSGDWLPIAEAIDKKRGLIGRTNNHIRGLDDIISYQRSQGNDVTEWVAQRADSRRLTASIAQEIKDIRTRADRLGMTHNGYHVSGVEDVYESIYRTGVHESGHIRTYQHVNMGALNKLYEDLKNTRMFPSDYAAVSKGEMSAEIYASFITGQIKKFPDERYKELFNALLGIGEGT